MYLTFTSTERSLHDTWPKNRLLIYKNKLVKIQFFLKSVWGAGKNDQH